MSPPAIPAMIVYLTLLAIPAESLPNCSEVRHVGRFEIYSYLNLGGGRAISVNYSIPRRHIRPRGTGYSPPSITLSYEYPLGRGYQNVIFLEGESLPTELPFPTQSMSVRCGRSVIL